MRKFLGLALGVFWGLSCSSVQAQNIVFVSKDIQVSDEEKQNTSDMAESEGSLKEKKAETIEELTDKAENGDVDAMLDLGYMHLYGLNGINVDYQKALAYYEQAAEQKSAIAYNNLGSLYFNGIGIEADRKKAISFFEEASKLGSSDAAVNLAIIYLGDTKNINEAQYTKIRELLTQAQADNNIAKYLLGYCYYKGFLFDKNDKKAFSLIKAAADSEYDEAQFILSEFYISGNGAPKNYNKAIEYLQMAAAQGNPDAIMKLAGILTEGKIYTKDIKKAHILYNVAAVMGLKGAAEKRDMLEKNFGIEDLLTIQAEAENYKAQPSEQTLFVRQTFGNSLKAYIDVFVSEDKNNETTED